VLRIIIEQEDREGASPQIQTITASDITQARDGGGAPQSVSALRSRAMKGQAQASASIPRHGDAGVRDAGSAPQVLQVRARRGAVMLPISGHRVMVKPSNGGKV
jgi:hypothetical protein